MKIKEAYTISVQTIKVAFGSDGHYFTTIGWKSPSTKRIHGPYFVTISGDQAIEVSRKGKFVNVFPAITENYFPWVEKSS